MSTQGSSRAMYTGLIIMCARCRRRHQLRRLRRIIWPNMIAAGVRTADDPAAPIGPTFAAFAGARAFMRRNLAVVGLVLVSSASTAVAGETGPTFSFMIFVLLVFGVSV
uniref:Uncharacterized protein n=1 Tax=Setaria viridis TaxID=4556 RepID=A0A4U6U315_SETVI|nr:hypothetical protein SEVIR_6G038100v2 [Setaria viridis]